MKTGLEFPQPIQHPIFHCDNCDFDFALLNVWPPKYNEGYATLTPMGEHTDGSWYCPHCGCKQIANNHIGDVTEMVIANEKAGTAP
jgi:hypothetical protein